MSQSRAKAVVITDSTGLRGTIDPTSQPLDGSKEQVLARFEDGLQVLVPFDELIWEKDGSYSLPFSVEELEPQTDAGSHSREEETIVMPVVAEKLDVTFDSHGI